MPLLRKSIFRVLLLLLFIVYIIILLKVIIFKDAFINSYTYGSWKKNFLHANLVPFYNIRYYLRGEEPFEVGVLNIVGNIIAFIPFGFLLPLLFLQLRSFKKTFVTVLLTSLSFELIQLFITYGHCDVDDIILNTTGGVIGYLIYIIILGFLNKV